MHTLGIQISPIQLGSLRYLHGSKIAKTLQKKNDNHYYSEVVALICFWVKHGETWTWNQQKYGGDWWLEFRSNRFKTDPHAIPIGT